MLEKSPEKTEKTDEDSEKEEEPQTNERPRRTRKVKKTPEKTPDEDSDEDSTTMPKGRDFDLNQIRSELKGVIKPITTSIDLEEKEASEEEITILHLIF